MIFYFSGTGNSQYAAENVAKAQGETLISIAEELDKKDHSFEYSFKENELLGFIYPVHAWGPAKMVLDFINKIKISGGTPYVFSLCTCGENEGLTTRMVEKALDKKWIPLDSAFSVEMPNNYILGFDVDSEEVEAKKLKSSVQTLQGINVVLKKRQKGVFHLLPGKVPGLKSALVNPLFNRFAMNTKKFYATEDCTRCGICEKNCPIHTIRIIEKPVWDQACTMCLACINRCPVNAIQYGKGTIGRGRYLHPILKEVPIL